MSIQILSGLNTYNTWKKFFEFLNMKYMDGVVKDEYGQTQKSWISSRVFKFNCKRRWRINKNKNIKTDIDASYKENINNGHKYLRTKRL